MDRNIAEVRPKGNHLLSPPARVAWIETIVTGTLVIKVPMSPPARVAWIETIAAISHHRKREESPPARVAWIETPKYWFIENPRGVATREGGVDRNICRPLAET